MALVLAGFLTGFSLIVAIGAQNAYVLRMGITKSHVGLVVVLCCVSDGLLIALGIGGLGRIFRAVPVLLTICKWVGVAYLVFFAIATARRMFSTSGLTPERDDGLSRSNVVATTLALTWLNPHVYLDTVLLIGSVGNQYGAHRWWFGLGAALASVAWFCGLGFGARLLATAMRRPQTWRILDGAIVVVLIVVAINVAMLRVP